MIAFVCESRLHLFPLDHQEFAARKIGGPSAPKRNPHRLVLMPQDGTKEALRPANAAASKIVTQHSGPLVSQTGRSPLLPNPAQPWEAQRLFTTSNPRGRERTGAEQARPAPPRVFPAAPVRGHRLGPAAPPRPKDGRLETSQHGSGPRVRAS